MKKTVSYLLVTLAFGLATSVPAGESEGRRATANYARPFEPPVRAAFIPLPPGKVQPRGWLRDWCILARDGMTGHLDELDPSGESKQCLEQGWTPDKTAIPEMAVRDPKDLFPYPVNDNEVLPYWTDGMIRLGYVLDDDFLLRRAKKHYDVIVDKVDKDSVLFMWWVHRHDQALLKRLGKDARMLFHEPDDISSALQWSSSLVGDGLAAYYAGSGQRRVLRALETAYSGERRWTAGSSCWANAFPAFETYTWSGNPEIRGILTGLFRQCRIDRPNVEGTYLGSEKFPAQVRHSVCLYEKTGAWPIGYLWEKKGTGTFCAQHPEGRSGKRCLSPFSPFLDTPRLWLDLVDRDSMQPFGVNVGDEYLGLTSAFRGTESCDIVHSMWNYIWLLRIGGEATCADRVERAFLNAGPAAVSRDFKTHVYYQSPNRISATLPGAAKGMNSRFNFRPFHRPKCCTYNLQRMLPLYVMHMWMATYDNGLAWTLYGPCAVDALAGNGVPVKLEATTAYPFEETIRLKVSPRRDAEFPLYFRLPEWAGKRGTGTFCAQHPEGRPGKRCLSHFSQAPSIRVNGSDVAATDDGRGFVRVARLWKPGDQVELRFPMPVRVTGGHDHGVEQQGIDAAGGLYASLYLGPLLMVLPIADLGPNTPDAGAPWQYAFDLPSADAIAKLVVRRAAMPEKWDWPLRSPVELSLPAARADWVPKALSGQIRTVCLDRLYTLPAGPVKAKSTETIRLVPYGCTKFRISMFPITQRASWVAEPSAGLPPTTTDASPPTTDH